MKTYLIPVSGEPLPYPGGVLPAEGDEIEMDRFWRRRLRDGSVVTGRPRRAIPPAEQAESVEEPASKPATTRTSSRTTKE